MSDNAHRLDPEFLRYGKAAILSLMATRGEAGITEEEAGVVEAWVRSTLMNHKILQLIEEGKVFVNVDENGHLTFRSPETGSEEEDYLRGIVW